jgi:hypothetical protein
MLIRALSASTIAVITSVIVAHAEPVDPAQAIAQKFSEASDEKKPAPAVVREKPGTDADYETDMLQRARAEELDRQKEDAQRTAIKPAIPVEPPVALPAPQSPTRAPAQTVAALPPKPAPEPVNAPAPSPAPGPAAQATVLLVLDTGGTALGYKPDPIICIDEKCWLSNGIGAPALAMPRTQAVALPTTDDVTADSCSGKSACVYRGVSIAPDARIDVIQVGEGHGASAGAYTVATDESCRKDHNDLLCDNGLATQNFRIWVVPEAIAESAGNATLEDAVADGLPDTDTEPSNDK